jgi:Cdc6-like AAA superfamily ATPase
MQSRRSGVGDIKARVSKIADRQKLWYQDKTVLDPSVPYDNVIGRINEMYELSLHLDGFRCSCPSRVSSDVSAKECPHLPSDIHIRGPTGTGKTHITRRVCEEIVGKGNYIIINLRTAYSPFSAVNSLLHEMGLKDRIWVEGLNTAVSEAKREIKKRLDARKKAASTEVFKSSSDPSLPPFVIVLDELDTALRHSGHHKSTAQDILDSVQGMTESLRLAGYPVCIVVITNETLENHDIDEKSLSRLCKQIVFHPLGSQDLFDILLDRSQRAFPPGRRPSQTVLQAIADYCHSQNGSARIAIELLRATSLIAFERGALDPSYITLHDLESAKQRVIADLRRDVVDSLAPEEAVVAGAIALLCVLKRTEWHSTDEVVRCYGKLVESIWGKQVAELVSQTRQPILRVREKRTIEDYLARLEERGIVESDRSSRGKGRGRESRKYHLRLEVDVVGAYSLGKELWVMIRTAQKQLSYWEVEKQKLVTELKGYDGSCFIGHPFERQLYEEEIAARMQMADTKIKELKSLLSLDDQSLCGGDELCTHLMNKMKK